MVPGAEIESFATATTMAIGMVAWMRYRGHEWRHISEMSAAIYAGLVVLFPALWLEMLDAVRVLVYGHMLMLIFMLLPMLCAAKPMLTLTVTDDPKLTAQSVTGYAVWHRSMASMVLVMVVDA